MSRAARLHSLARRISALPSSSPRRARLIAERAELIRIVLAGYA